MKYQDILNNEHFNNLAAIIRVPFHSKEWRRDHPEVPFWKMIDDLNDVKTEQHFIGNKAEFTKRLLALLAELTHSDERLSYTQDDLKWLLEVIDSENALSVVSIFIAWFSAPDEMLTPVEVAELTGTNESNWRNKAAAGEIPGAQKKGKQWLLPKSVLVAKGILTNERHS